MGEVIILIGCCLFVCFSWLDGFVVVCFVLLLFCFVFVCLFCFSCVCGGCGVFLLLFVCLFVFSLLLLLFPIATNNMVSVVLCMIADHKLEFWCCSRKTKFWPCLSGASIPNWIKEEGGKCSNPNSTGIMTFHT